MIMASSSSSLSLSSLSKDTNSHVDDVMILKFVPFSSTVELPFWVKYCQVKLETIQLSQDPIPIIGSYHKNNVYNARSHAENLTPTTAAAGAAVVITNKNRFQLQESSLFSFDNNNSKKKNNNNNTADHNNNSTEQYRGLLIGYNTKEEFQTVNKNKLLHDIFCQEFFGDTDHTVEGQGRQQPSLVSFVLLTFADLKQHKVLYWFGFPTLLTKSPITATILTSGRNTTTTPNVKKKNDQEEEEQEEDTSCRLWWEALAEGLYYYCFEQQQCSQQQQEQEQEQEQDKKEKDRGIQTTTTTTTTENNSSSSNNCNSSTSNNTIPAYFVVPSSSSSATAASLVINSNSNNSTNNNPIDQSRLHPIDFVAPLTQNSYQQISDNRKQNQTKSSNTNNSTNHNNVVFGCVDPTMAETAPSNNTNTTTNNNIVTMGWPMRNLIAYLVFHLQLEGQTVQILSLRHGGVPSLRRRHPNQYPNQQQSGGEQGGGDAPMMVTQREIDTLRNDSILMQLKLPLRDDYEYNNNNNNKDKKKDTDTNTKSKSPSYKVVGWELNARNKAGPRLVNLRPLLDRKHLAIQAADLNLKLMKWRMIPELNVTMLQKSCKVLILGSGTLGCSVSRTLLGWGLRDFTFVDYGTVSYSNPVRQILFNLEDCHNNSGGAGGGGKPKSIAAAEALKRIAADVVSEGIQLSIPMPGHAFDEKDGSTTLQDTVELLDTLIRTTDVVFLLTDTRESRWLPTVMAAVHDKILINAALGLDSWLVMRHGHGCGGGISSSLKKKQQPLVASSSPSSRLGCYFCNDVVAPENSTRNRTLDQQCTVTRPGLAPIASSMAVELLISLLHHPRKQRAPAPPVQRNNNSNHNAFSPVISNTSSNKDGENSSNSPLGVIPHQIRGSIVTYTMMTPSVPAFDCCTGCSMKVLDAYWNDKLEFVSRVCTSSGRASTTTNDNARTNNTHDNGDDDGFLFGSAYLEHVSGLAQFRADAAAKIAEMEDEYNWDIDNGSDDDNMDDF